MVKLVEQCSGTGDLIQHNKVVRQVRYDLSVFQGMLGDSELPIPGQRTLTGSIDFDASRDSEDLVGPVLTHEYKPDHEHDEEVSSVGIDLPDFERLVLSHIPRLPETVIRRVIGDLGNLDAVVRASQRDLEAVEGVGTVRAREIREGLRRLQEHNLVDRYLQL